MKHKASLFSSLYGIGFCIVRRWVMNHERPRSEITEHKRQITKRKSQITNLKSQGWATVYSFEGRWDTMQSLGDAGDDAGSLRHTRCQDGGSCDELTKLAHTGND